MNNLSQRRSDDASTVVKLTDTEAADVARNFRTLASAMQMVASKVEDTKTVPIDTCRRVIEGLRIFANDLEIRLPKVTPLGEGDNA